MPEEADQPWLRLDNPATSGGGHHKNHCEKYNRDTPGWLLAHSLGRQPGQGGSIPEYAAALHSSQPSGSATVEVGLARGKGAWVFLQPLLGWSLLLGVAEQPFPSRKVPWPSAVAKKHSQISEQYPSTHHGTALPPAGSWDRGLAGGGWHPAARDGQFPCPLWVTPVSLDGEELPPSGAQ